MKKASCRRIESLKINNTQYFMYRYTCEIKKKMGIRPNSEQQLFLGRKIQEQNQEMAHRTSTASLVKKKRLEMKPFSPINKYHEKASF